MGSSTWCTATRSRSSVCSSIPISPPSASSARPRSPGHIYETGTEHGKRVQALAGAKNHMIVLPDADMELAADSAVSAGLRFGGRAVHGHLGSGDGRRRRRQAAAKGAGADRRARRWDRAWSRTRRWVRSSPRNTATGSPPTSTRAIEQGADAARRRPGPDRAAAMRTASSSGPRCSTMSSTDMTIYQDEIFGPVLSVVRTDSLRRTPSS